MTEHNFVEEWIPVGSLEVDPGIQRAHLDLRKIERMVKNFNPAALGVVTVSERNKVTKIVLDGMHRRQAVSLVTDNTGKLLCHVFKKLSRAEEAQMFLDLNNGNPVSLLDKFAVRLVAEDPVALEIDQLTKAYGWTIGSSNKQGTIQCVGTVEKIYRGSVSAEAEPNYLQIALMLITHAWGNDKDGVQAAILDGMSAVAAVYGSDLDVGVMERRMKVYKGGPLGLLTDGQQLAAMKKGKNSMGVAERIVDHYNTGVRVNRRLPAWRRKS
jgi:hypothetical protein